MRERLVTLACALGALALFLAMFIHGDQESNRNGEVPRPTSEERRPNGYHAAMVWLDQQRIRTVSLRERFNVVLTRPRLRAAGNLLIATLPTATAFKTEELRALEGWIRSGNTMLVLAALSDNPDWAFVLGRTTVSELSLLTGLQFEAAKTRATSQSASEIGARIAATARAYARPHYQILVPNGSLPLFEGVHTVSAVSDYPASAWTLKIPYDGFALSLASERETGDGVLWTRPLGGGRVIVSGMGSVFTNRALGLADNGQFLANIVGSALGPGGEVLFDDMHQGLGAAYDPAKFYSDPRLYETIAIVAALWLCWVLGSSRLQLPMTRAPVPREAELVQTTGVFLARVLKSDAAARGLFEHFFRRIRGHLPSTGDSSTPPWKLLEALPGVSTAELHQLRQWYVAAHAAREVPLERLQNLMVKVDRHLTA